MAGARQKKRIEDQKKKQKRRTLLPRLLTALLLATVIAVAVGISIAPPQYRIKAGDIAAETIKATKDVVDTVNTQAKREEARSSVKQIYRSDDEAAKRVNDKYSALIGVIEAVREGADNAKIELPTFEYTKLFLDAQRQKFEEAGITITDDQLLYILDDMKENEPGVIKITVFNVINEEMASGIRDDAINDRKTSIKNRISESLSTGNITGPLVGLLENATDVYLEANMLRDDDATNEARDKAASEVADIIYKKGQTIITDGEVITAAQIEMVDSLGLLDNPSENIYLYAGLIIFSIVTVLILLLYIYLCEKETYYSYKKVVMLFVLYMFSLVLCVLFSYINIMLMPVIVCSMMVALLLNMNIAIVAQTLLSLTAGIIAYFANDASVSTAFIIAASGIVGGGAAAYFSRKVTQRSRIFIAGACGGILSALTVLALSFLFVSDLSGLFYDILSVLCGAVLSSIICIGVLPLLEIMFKEYTAMRMLELSNHSNPLLQKLLQEAPGSYHHSLLVANIAENCAMAIGADVLLVRAGAYFHDVGKMKSPRFFKENQTNENPHDNLPPESSVRILNGHTTEGVAMAKKAKLPEKVLRIIQEHHGTMPAMYFYQKARDLYGDATVHIEEYQYPGPIPSSKESAVIMLADAAEAAVRACQDHSREKTAEIIKNIIEKRCELHQLDDCGLSFKELRIIEETLNNTMNRLYHERIEYPPEATKPEEVKKGE